MTLALPKDRDVAAFLRDLLDRPVKVGRGKPERVGKRVKGSCGLYRNDDGSLAAAWVCDHGFGSSAGAALSLIAPAAATDMLKTDGMSTGPLNENLSEVFNIGASLFNDGDVHVRFTEMIVDDKLPDDVATSIKGTKRRLDLAIDVGGYAGGQVSVFAF